MKGGRIAVFLDRDGTINEEVSFVRTPEELQLIPGAAAAIRRLNKAGAVTCIISNQSGIARGYLSEDDLVRVHARLAEELEHAGARVDRIYYCPHHPTEGSSHYTVVCACRKPAPGMLLQAEEELGLDLSRSFVVGDRAGDVEAGINVGASTVLVLTGYGKEAQADMRARNIIPTHTAPSLAEAVRWIVQQIEGESPTHE